jgi:hypothetical protein
MSDKKKKNEEIEKVGSATKAERVKKAHEVDSVEKVKGAEAVRGVGSIESTGRRATRLMTMEEREKYFQIISEEAQNLLGGKLGKDKISQVENAVKMAIDTGLLDQQAKKK